MIPNHSKSPEKTVVSISENFKKKNSILSKTESLFENSESGISLDCKAEFDKLCSLNRRLRDYFKTIHSKYERDQEKVKELENENSFLNEHISKLEDSLLSLTKKNDELEVKYQQKLDEKKNLLLTKDKEFKTTTTQLKKENKELKEKLQKEVEVNVKKTIKEKEETFQQQTKELKDRMNKYYHEVLSLKEEELSELKENYNQLQQKSIQFNDLKSKVDAEILKYDNILTNEETKLKISIEENHSNKINNTPILSLKEKKTTPGSSRKRKSQVYRKPLISIGKNKKTCIKNEATLNVIKVAQNGEISLHFIDVHCKFIQLLNISNDSICLDAWSIKGYRDTNEAVAYTFEFPLGTTIKSNEILTVYTSFSDKTTNDGLYWDLKEPIWSNEEGFVELIDARNCCVSACKLEDSSDGGHFCSLQ